MQRMEEDEVKAKATKAALEELSSEHGRVVETNAALERRLAGLQEALTSRDETNSELRGAVGSLTAEAGAAKAELHGMAQEKAQLASELQRLQEERSRLAVDCAAYQQRLQVACFRVLYVGSGCAWCHCMQHGTCSMR